MKTFQTSRIPCAVWFRTSVGKSIENGWLAPSFSDKRFNAICRVFRKIDRVDSEVFDTLPVVTFHVPSLDCNGEVIHEDVKGVLVYLSPTLEFNSQRDVDHVVAHELAHVALGHDKKDNETEEDAKEHSDRPAEKAADALAEKWGFTARKKGQSAFVKMAIDVWTKKLMRRMAKAVTP